MYLMTLYVHLVKSISKSSTIILLLFILLIILEYILSGNISDMPRAIF
jgi:hypothetical protein